MGGGVVNGDSDSNEMGVRREKIREGAKVQRCKEMKQTERTRGSKRQRYDIILTMLNYVPTCNMRWLEKCFGIHKRQCELENFGM
jgi:hypothetical protein